MNSLGNGKSERNISVKYRGTDPSYLGNLDINVYSSSSPGLNGSLTPFAHTNGLYFNDEPEPQNQEYIIAKELENRDREKGYTVITYGNNPIDYYNNKFAIREVYQGIKVSHNEDPNKIYIRFVDDEEVGII